VKVIAAIVGAAFIASAWLPMKPEPNWNERLGYSFGMRDPHLGDLAEKMRLESDRMFELLDNPRIHLPSDRPTFLRAG
jgi:hypothetical protein